LWKKPAENTQREKCLMAEREKEKGEIRWLGTKDKYSPILGIWRKKGSGGGRVGGLCNLVSS